MQKIKPMKLTGKRSLCSKLRRLATEFETDAKRLDGTPYWQTRLKLRGLAGSFQVLAAAIERGGLGWGVRADSGD